MDFLKKTDIANRRFTTSGIKFLNLAEQQNLLEYGIKPEFAL